jgi:exopolyphosphatase / guanosine-5'-triphosphate,3'-diphosphate pyrophosphatase
VEQGRLTLELPQDLEGLGGDRLNSRMKALGKLIGREPVVRAVPTREAAE